MIWSKIIEWFKERSERDDMIKSFNYAARDIFEHYGAPTLLEAVVQKGDPAFRHECSSFLLKTGFCIRATSGRALSKEEMLYIGSLILNDQSLTRRLFILGWDTLTIDDIIGKKQVKWAIKDFTNMGNLIEY